MTTYRAFLKSISNPSQIVQKFSYAFIYISVHHQKKLSVSSHTHILRNRFLSHSTQFCVFLFLYLVLCSEDNFKPYRTRPICYWKQAIHKPLSGDSWSSSSTASVPWAHTERVRSKLAGFHPPSRGDTSLGCGGTRRPLESASDTEKTAMPERRRQHTNRTRLYVYS